MTRQQESKKTLLSLLEVNLQDIGDIRKKCAIVSLVDIRNVYKAFGFTPVGKDKDMLIGTLRNVLYGEIQEKLEDLLWDID